MVGYKDAGGKERYWVGVEEQRVRGGKVRRYRIIGRLQG